MFERLARSTSLSSVNDPTLLVAHEGFLLVDRMDEFQDFTTALQANRDLSETKTRAIALKAAIETYGMTPSLMAYANFNGNLTDAASVVDAASLETLSEDDSAVQKQQLLSAVEAFINSDDDLSWDVAYEAKSFFVSQEETSEGEDKTATESLALIAGAYAGYVGTLYVIQKLVNDGKCKGNAKNASDLIARVETAISLMKKIQGIAIPKKGESTDGVKSAINSMEASLKKVGIDVENGGSDYTVMGNSEIVLKPQRFGDAGITPEVFKNMIKMHDSLSKELWDTAQDLDEKVDTKVHNHKKDNWDKKAAKLVSWIGMELVDDAAHSLSSLRCIVKTSKRFFSKTKLD